MDNVTFFLLIELIPGFTLIRQLSFERIFKAAVLFRKEALTCK